MSIKKSAVACCMLLATASSFAQSLENKIYFGAEIGSSKVDNATGELTSSLVSVLGGSATATQDASMRAFKFLAGYQVNENIDLEGAYISTSSINLNFSGVSSGNVAYSGSQSVKYSGFQYSANLRPNVSTGLNNLYAIVGGHNLTADASLAVRAGNVSVASSASKSGSGTLLGIGYDMPIEKDTNFRFAVTKYSKVAGLDIDGTIISFGLSKKF